MLMNPAGSDIYRKIENQYLYDPHRGRIWVHNHDFYKYTMPLASNKI